MRKATNSPAKYVQGKNELGTLQKTVSTLGKTGVFAIVDPFILREYGERIASSFTGDTFPLTMEAFGGESSQREIDRQIEHIRSAKCDIVVGIGGGKTLDTAKAAAYHTGFPAVIVPTAASSDAPCSALSVLYHDDGTFDRYLPLPQNPNLVLVDTDIIAAAPARLFAAGMGDALATFYEARSCSQSKAQTIAGGTCSLSALALSIACRDSLFADGYKALVAIQNHAVTPAVENIIETNIYLSGIGFESGGLAAAHALHDGLTLLEETHDMLHGEKVAFGTLVHLVLENAPQEEIAQVLHWCKQIGLPTSLELLGVKTIDNDQIMEVAKSSCEEGKPMHNMPFTVTPDDVYAAILTANQLGSHIY